MTTSFLNDLIDQPSALQATLDDLSSTPPLTSINRYLSAGRYRRVILTGMGSSYHGLYPLQLRLIDRGLCVIRLETAELIHYAQELLDSHSLIVAVSQSGQSAEVVQLLQLTGGKATVVGVTNTPGSTLAEKASAVLLTQAGVETSVSCKTYISGLAALTWLGDELTGERKQFTLLSAVPQMVAQYWSSWQDGVSLLSQQLKSIKSLFLLGRGPSLAAVGTGALIIKEAARFPAEGMSSAAFRHGPLELISSHCFVMVYQGAPATTDLNTRLAEEIRLAGGLVETVGMRPGSPPFNLPACPLAALTFLEIMPAQLLSLALAEMQGIEAGQLVHASKVTATE